MKKIAILYICTGEYIVFWKEFFETCEQFFLEEYQKEYYVFTDNQDVYASQNCERIHVIYQEQLGWPQDTLMRYHIFWKIEDKLQNFDYIYFLNANVKCVNPIGEEFLPKNENLVAVQHPGFFDKDKYSYPYERNSKSEAYIGFGSGEYYLCGGVNGGKTKEYLEMIYELKEKINEDLKRNIIAIWHDESHINKYMLGRTDVKVLAPNYCFPENWDIPFLPFLVIREKKNYFDVKKVKGPQKRNQLLYQVRKFQGILHRKMKNGL